MRTARRRRVVLVAAAAAAIVLLLLVLAQALLPGVAATRVRERVERYGAVRRVHVSAFPAVKLLWGHADTVSVDAAALTLTPAQVASLLWEARTVGTLTVSAQRATVRVAQLPGGLEVGDVRMSKRGSAVLVNATLTQTQLQHALPSGFEIQPTAAGGGEIEARAAGGLFGVRASLNVLVRPSEGALIAEPRGLPFGGIASVTLFSDPHLKVESVGLSVLRTAPRTYALSLRALVI